MYSEGRDLGDVLASWEEDVARYRIAAGADVQQQAVQVAIVMEHVPAAYRDLLKVAPWANRETYQTLRACVRQWPLVQRTCDDLGRHMAHDTAAPSDNGQVKGATGTGAKGKKSKSKGEGDGKKDIGGAKGNAQTDDSYFAGECGKSYTRWPSAGNRRKTKKVNLRPQKQLQLLESSPMLPVR